MEYSNKYRDYLISALIGGVIVFVFCWFNPRIEKVYDPTEVTKVVENTIYQPIKVTDTVYVGQTISGQEKTSENNSDVIIEDIKANNAKISAVDESGKIWGSWEIQPTIKKDEPFFMNNQIKLGTEIKSKVEIDITPFVEYAISKERKKNSVGVFHVGSTTALSYGREIKQHVKAHILYGRDWPDEKNEFGIGISKDF